MRSALLSALLGALLPAVPAAPALASTLACRSEFYGTACEATNVALTAEAELVLTKGGVGSRAAKAGLAKLKPRDDIVTVRWDAALPAGAKAAAGTAVIIVEAHDFLNQGHLVKDCFIPFCRAVEALKPTVVGLPLRCPGFAGEACREKLDALFRAVLPPGVRLLTPEQLRKDGPAAVSFAKATLLGLTEDIAARDGKFAAGWQRGLPGCAAKALPRLIGAPPPRPPKPRLLIVSRKGSRKLTNEAALVRVAAEMGYDARLVSQWAIPMREQVKLMQSADVFVAVHGAVWGNCAFLRRGATAIQLVPDCMWNRPWYKMCFKNPNKKIMYYKKMVELTGATYLEWQNPPASQKCPGEDEDIHCRGGHKLDVTVPEAAFKTLLLRAKRAAVKSSTVTSQRLVWPGIVENVHTVKLEDAADRPAAARGGRGGGGGGGGGAVLKEKEVQRFVHAFDKQRKFDWPAFAALWRRVMASAPEMAHCRTAGRTAIPEPKRADVAPPSCVHECSPALRTKVVDDGSVHIGGSQVSWQQVGRDTHKLLRFGYSCEGCPGHKPRTGNRLHEFELAQRLAALPDGVRQHFSGVLSCSMCRPKDFRQFPWFKKACAFLKHDKSTAQFRHPSNHWAYDEFVCDGTEGHADEVEEGREQRAHVFTEVERNAMEENTFDSKHTFGGSGEHRSDVAALSFILQAAAGLSIAHSTFGFVHNDLGVNAGPRNPRVQNFGAERLAGKGSSPKCVCYRLGADVGAGDAPLCTDLQITRGFGVRFYDYDNAKKHAWKDGMHLEETQHAARAMLRRFAATNLDEDGAELRRR